MTFGLALGPIVFAALAVGALLHAFDRRFDR